LTARTVTQGTVQNFTYTYDRYGNRWAQNAPQGGPALSITFNQGNNIINSSGFTNDVLGNVSDDTFHRYSYDADGNLIAVDGGATASYDYDSLNQRVRIAPTRGTYEFVFDTMGRRVSTWYAATHAFVESNAYTDWGPIAIRSGGQTQFEHQNWLGTERVRTTYNGAVALSISSLPWADDHTPSGDNGDQHDFAGMERDLEDSSEHAQFRQFSTNLGRWQSPDPYLGNYDLTNPQSFNRYSYALNNPSSLVDPSGLFTLPTGPCDPSISNCNPGYGPSNPPGCISWGTQGCIPDPNPGPPNTGGGSSGGGGTANPGKPFTFKVNASSTVLPTFQLQVAALEFIPFGSQNVIGGLGAAVGAPGPLVQEAYDSFRKCVQEGTIGAAGEAAGDMQNQATQNPEETPGLPDQLHSVTGAALALLTECARENPLALLHPSYFGPDANQVYPVFPYTLIPYL
jgi:RHS repeat-associated protein